MRVMVLALAALVAAVSRPGCGERTSAPCAPSDPGCYDPCAGKACGEECQACPPDATDCAEIAVVKACDPQGRCVPATTPPPCPHPDCVGKACGDECNPCGPDATCPTLIPSACDRFGQCSGDVPWLCHDPCAGKACGEACRACPPDAAGCAETMELKACDASGRCVSRTPDLACPP